MRFGMALYGYFRDGNQQGVYENPDGLNFFRKNSWAILNHSPTSSRLHSLICALDPQSVGLSSNPIASKGTVEVFMQDG